MAIGDKDRCVGCAMGAHPHDTYTATAPEVKRGERRAGDDAGCPRAGCRCTWRAPRTVPFGEPDPERLTDSELLYELAGALQIYARGAHPRIPALIDVARDRAAMFLRLT